MKKKGECRMHVITSYGLGEVDDIEWKGGASSLTVMLKKPFLKRNQMEMDRRDVFIVSNWVSVRVINVAARGLFSNMQFQPSEELAENILWSSVPSDEIVFLIDLKEGIFKVNGGLELLYDRIVILRPWVDRWAPERMDIYEVASDARKVFRQEESDMSGTTGGIASFIQLDGRQGGVVLGFYLAVSLPNGVVLKKDFDIENPIII